MAKRVVRKEMVFFFIVLAASAFGNGLSDSVYGNYFKEVFHVSTTQRAFIEFPRELPGLLCAGIVTFLSAYGMAKSNLVAQLCAFLGLLALSLLTPAFSVMLIFLFINSVGIHISLPLNDAIGMAIAEPGQVGKRIGQYASVRTAMGFAAGLVVFFGFRLHVFSFTTDVNLLFLIGAGAFLVAIVASILLVRQKTPVLSQAQKRRKLVFRKEYRYYYFVTMLNGVQKQIALVFGSWIIIELLGKKADTMSLLMITVSFVSIFFMRLLGRWIDRLGVKKMMYLDALTFIFVYIIYGFVVWGITGKFLPGTGWPVFAIYALFVLDRLSMQIGVVKSVYLRSIAVTPEEIPATLSAGTSLDHVVAIIAAQLSGLVWVVWGPQWVFFIAAFFSLGNLFVAWKIPRDKTVKTDPAAVQEGLLSEE